nr:immunoglobulin light chain junction region [Macaca mulatta]MOW15686.1 immunoglobulin light chain junction region [Macaca mulatta]MOW15761.1 immunoglobulin light chain junction region [Macaca mulatta]MOW16880.1 immunoglobulin light chain junction region [Macaca mulatta]MOW17220.1 immunoglobulin light chain junction region [Macaca mulatta]
DYYCQSYDSSLTAYIF